MANPLPRAIQSALNKSFSRTDSLYEGQAHSSLVIAREDLTAVLDAVRAAQSLAEQKEGHWRNLMCADAALKDLISELESERDQIDECLDAAELSGAA